MKRFQECSRIEKLWRYRWYLCIPFWYIKIFFINLFSGSIKDYIIEAKTIWEILIGEAQLKMNWYYTEEEVDLKLKSLYKKMDEIS